MDIKDIAAGPETVAFPIEDDINRMYAVMYYFAHRVAFGDATATEVVLMTSVFSLVERRGDWNLGIPHYTK